MEPDGKDGRDGIRIGRRGSSQTIILNFKICLCINWMCTWPIFILKQPLFRHPDKEQKLFSHFRRDWGWKRMHRRMVYKCAFPECYFFIFCVTTTYIFVFWCKRLWHSHGLYYSLSVWWSNIYLLVIIYS